MTTRLDRIGFHELAPTIRALGDAGVTTDDADWLRSPGNAAVLSAFLREKRGLADNREPAVKATEHATDHPIDCEATPMIPEGWRVEPEDQLAGAVGGKLLWDKTKIALFLAERQKKGLIGGHDLRKELEGEPVLKANVLDYLLAHTKLIPESWKGKYVFFWGTVYRYPGGYLYVRYLSWDGGGWSGRYRWLGRGWASGYPAAVRAR